MNSRESRFQKFSTFSQTNTISPKIENGPKDFHSNVLLVKSGATKERYQNLCREKTSRPINPSSDLFEETFSPRVKELPALVQREQMIQKICSTQVSHSHNQFVKIFEDVKEAPDFDSHLTQKLKHDDDFGGREEHYLDHDMTEYPSLHINSLDSSFPATTLDTLIFQQADVKSAAILALNAQYPSSEPCSPSSPHSSTSKGFSSPPRMSPNSIRMRSNLESLSSHQSSQLLNPQDKRRYEIDPITGRMSPTQGETSEPFPSVSSSTTSLPTLKPSSSSLASTQSRIIPPVDSETLSKYFGTDAKWQFFQQFKEYDRKKYSLVGGSEELETLVDGSHSEIRGGDFGLARSKFSVLGESFYSEINQINNHNPFNQSIRELWRLGVLSPENTPRTPPTPRKQSSSFLSRSTDTGCIPSSASPDNLQSFGVSQSLPSLPPLSAHISQPNKLPSLVSSDSHSAPSRPKRVPHLKTQKSMHTHTHPAPSPSMDANPLSVSRPPSTSTSASPSPYPSTRSSVNKALLPQQETIQYDSDEDCYVDEKGEVFKSYSAAKGPDTSHLPDLDSIFGRSYTNSPFSDTSNLPSPSMISSSSSPPLGLNPNQTSKFSSSISSSSARNLESTTFTRSRFDSKELYEEMKIFDQIQETKQKELQEREEMKKKRLIQKSKKYSNVQMSGKKLPSNPKSTRNGARSSRLSHQPPLVAPEDRSTQLRVTPHSSSLLDTDSSSRLPPSQSQDEEGEEEDSGLVFREEEEGGEGGEGGVDGDGEDEDVFNEMREEKEEPFRFINSSFVNEKDEAEEEKENKTRLDEEEEESEFGRVGGMEEEESVLSWGVPLSTSTNPPSHSQPSLSFINQLQHHPHSHSLHSPSLSSVHDSSSSSSSSSTNQPSLLDKYTQEHGEIEDPTKRREKFLLSSASKTKRSSLRTSSSVLSSSSSSSSSFSSTSDTLLPPITSRGGTSTGPSSLSRASSRQDLPTSGTNGSRTNVNLAPSPSSSSHRLTPQPSTLSSQPQPSLATNKSTVTSSSSSSSFNAQRRKSSNAKQNESLTQYTKSCPLGAQHLKSPLATFIAGCIKHNIPPRAIAVIRKHFTSKIDLSHLGLGDTVGILLAKALEEMPALRAINFKDNNFTDLSLTKLIDSLAKQPFLEELDLSSNKIGSSAAGSLASFIGKKGCPLFTLRLGNSNIDDGECVRFVNALMNNNVLQELDLSQNLLGMAEQLNAVKPDIVTGGEALANLLRSPACRIHTLNVHWNSIRMSSATDICDAIRQNFTLTHLNLSYNAIGREASSVLGNALLDNHTLKELVIAYNSMDAMGCFTICVGAKQHPQLSLLDFSGNPIGELGAHMLMNISKLVGERLKFKANCCDLTVRPAGVLMNVDEPEKSYSLDLTDAYERAVFIELLDIVARNPLLDFRHFEYFEPGSNAGKPMSFLRYREKIPNLRPIEQEELIQLYRIKEVNQDSGKVLSLFNQFDLKGRGELRPRKFKRFLHALGLSSMTNTRIAGILSTTDLTGKGTIAFEEILDFLASESMEAEDRIYSIESRPVMANAAYPGVKYEVPSTGRIKFEVKKIPLKSEDRLEALTTQQCQKVMEGAMSTSEPVTMMNLIIKTSKVYVEEAQFLFERFQTIIQEDDVSLISKILPCMKTQHDAANLIKIYLGADTYSIRRLKQKIGFLYGPAIGMYNGYYHLDLSRESDRLCLKILLERSRSSTSDRKNKGLNDVSQQGNWSCFRNELPTPISPSTFTYVSSVGNFQFDYIDIIRPDLNNERCFPVKDQVIIEILCVISLLDRKNSNQIDWAINYLKDLREAGIRTLNPTGVPYWSADMGRVLRTGDVLEALYSNSKSRLASYHKSYRKEQNPFASSGGKATASEGGTSGSKSNKATGNPGKSHGPKISPNGIHGPGSGVVDTLNSSPHPILGGEQNDEDDASLDSQSEGSIDAGLSLEADDNASLSSMVSGQSLSSERSGLRKNLTHTRFKSAMGTNSTSPKHKNSSSESLSPTAASASISTSTSTSTSNGFDRALTRNTFRKSKFLKLVELAHQQSVQNKIQQLSFRPRSSQKNHLSQYDSADDDDFEEETDEDIYDSSKLFQSISAKFSSIVNDTRCSNEYKSAQILEYCTNTFTNRWILCRHLSLILKCFRCGSTQKTIFGSYRVELIVTLFSRILDLHNFEFVLMSLNADEVAGIHARIGILNYFNPCKAEGCHRFNLSRPDERIHCKLLIHLSLSESGKTWRDCIYIRDKLGVMPGWELTQIWYGEGGVPKQGVIYTRYTSGEGMHLDNCSLNRVVRRMLLPLVLCRQSDMIPEDDDFEPLPPPRPESYSQLFDASPLDATSICSYETENKSSLHVFSISKHSPDLSHLRLNPIPSQILSEFSHFPAHTERNYGFKPKNSQQSFLFSEFTADPVYTMEDVTRHLTECTCIAWSYSNSSQTKKQTTTSSSTESSANQEEGEAEEIREGTDNRE